MRSANIDLAYGVPGTVLGLGVKEADEDVAIALRVLMVCLEGQACINEV